MNYDLVQRSSEEKFHSDLLCYYEGKMSLEDVVWLDGYIGHV